MSKTTTTKTTRKPFAPSILAESHRLQMLELTETRSALGELFAFAKNLEAAMPSIGTKTAKQTWEAKEEEFLAKHGQTWQETLDLQEQVEKDAYEAKARKALAGEQEPTAAATAGLPGLTPADVAGLKRVYNENPEARVPGAIWKRAFSGACASRRAGLDFRTWCKRSTALPRPVVADIAFRVWSLPESELTGNAPVRAAF